MAVNAKVYQAKTGKFYVQLYWKGRQYRRFHYDGDWPSMPYKDMADRIASAINADIDQKKRARRSFDPRQWFKTPGYEFQFSLYAEKWLLKNKENYAPSVKRDVERYVNLAIDHFQKMDMREIRKLDIVDFTETLPFAPKTIKNVLAVLHKMFTDAYDNEMIVRVPGWPKIEVPDPEIKWLTREWQDRIIEAIPERDRPIFIFLRTWGCRPGEARALMWDCVDFDKEQITIRRAFSGAGCNHLQEYTKTKRIRYLPFTQEISQIFKEIRGIGGFVFRNHEGRPYTADLSRIWNEARDSVEAPKVTLYQGTRHSFATQNIDKLDLVSIALGHTNANTTRKKYQGLNIEKIRGLVE